MTDLLKQVIPAGEEAIFSGGLFFKLVRAPVAPVSLVFERDSVGDAKAAAAPSGYVLGPLPETRRFNRVRVFSEKEQEVQILVGDDRADVTDIDVTISASARAGSLAIFERVPLTAGLHYLPFTVPTDHPLFQDGVVIVGWLFHAPSSNPNPFYVNTSPQLSGANKGLAIEPGDTQYLPSGFINDPSAYKQQYEIYSAAAGGEAEVMLFHIRPPVVV